LRLSSPSPEVTRLAARLLGEVLGDEGMVLALRGPLGAGKTAFVKGLAEGLGIDPTAVASPTFVIASEYEAKSGTGRPRRLAHVDLYRVGSEAELEAAGFLDLLEPGAVVAVEWADRLPGALPADRLDLHIERPGGEAAPALRVLHALGSGKRSEALLARWREALRSLPGLDSPVDQGPR